jgi:mono/diheme cytochrome c family protein
MRTRKIFFPAGIIFISTAMLLLFAQRYQRASGFPTVNHGQGFPEEILTIFTNSCFDCHTAGSQNKMANFALDFKGWDDYKDAKKAQLLIKIDKEVSEKNMPPKKYLERNPGKALTDEQVELISKWAKEESNNLSK